MKHLFWVAFLGLIGVLGQTADPPITDAEAALQEWDEKDRQMVPERLSLLATFLVHNVPKGSHEVIRRLTDIVRDHSRVFVSRGEALRVACQLADSASATTILEAVQGSLPSTPQTYVSFNDEVIGQHLLLVYTFVKDCAPHLLKLMEDQRPLASYLKHVYTSRSYSLGTVQQCASLIADLEPSIRKSVVLEVVQKRGIVGGTPEFLVDVLDSTTFPALRSLVRSESTPQRFHHAGADALSYLGDTEIVADLEGLRPAFRSFQDVNMRNPEGALLRYLWRIEVQNPPEKLLDYISSVDFREYRDDRSWAVRRALKRGIDPARIREAILEHARKAADSHDKRERAELPALKDTGQDLGILREDDLPEVKVYRVHVRETP